MSNSVHLNLTFANQESFHNSPTAKFVFNFNICLFCSVYKHCFLFPSTHVRILICSLTLCQALSFVNFNVRMEKHIVLVNLRQKYNVLYTWSCQTDNCQLLRKLFRHLARLVKYLTCSWCDWQLLCTAKCRAEKCAHLRKWLKQLVKLFAFYLI